MAHLLQLDQRHGRPAHPLRRPHPRLTQLPTDTQKNAQAHRRRLVRLRGPRRPQAGRGLRLHPQARLPPDRRRPRRHARDAAHPTAQRVGQHPAWRCTRFVDELAARVRRAGAVGEIVMRADSGFWSYTTIARLARHQIRYSIGVTLQPHVRAAIAEIDESCLAAACRLPRNGRRRDRRDDPTATRRLIVRRTRSLGPAARQRSGPTGDTTPSSPTAPTSSRSSSASIASTPPSSSRSETTKTARCGTCQAAATPPTAPGA